MSDYTTKAPPQRLRIGFAELAEHMGVDSDEIRRLVDAGEIDVVIADPMSSIRLVTRAAANRFLARRRLPLVPAEK